MVQTLLLLSDKSFLKCHLLFLVELGHDFLNSNELLMLLANIVVGLHQVLPPLVVFHS